MNAELNHERLLEPHFGTSLFRFQKKLISKLHSFFQNESKTRAVVKIKHQQKSWERQILNDHLIPLDHFPSGYHIIGFYGQGNKQVRFVRKR